jgi:hypothetical protein
MNEVIEIKEKLLPQGLIEIVLALQIGLDDGMQAFLLVERAAWRYAHQKKTNRDYEKERWYCRKKSPYYVG